MIDDPFSNLQLWQDKNNCEKNQIMVPNRDNIFSMYSHHRRGTNYVGTRSKNNGPCAVMRHKKASQIFFLSQQ